MRELLGRELKIDDLVVVKGTGRYNLGLRIGIYCGSSVEFEGGKTSYTECFLVENPSEKELEVKNNILEARRKSEEMKLRKKEEAKKVKAIPYKDIIKGKIYKNADGNMYIYLGYGVFNQKNPANYSRRRSMMNMEGHIYIPVYEYNLKKNIPLKVDYDTLDYAKIIKTKYKLVSEVETDLDKEIIEELSKSKSITVDKKYTNFYRDNIRCEINIILED